MRLIKTDSLNNFGELVYRPGPGCLLLGHLLLYKSVECTYSAHSEAWATQSIAAGLVTVTVLLKTGGQ